MYKWFSWSAKERLIVPCFLPKAIEPMPSYREAGNGERTRPPHDLTTCVTDRYAQRDGFFQSIIIVLLPSVSEVSWHEAFYNFTFWYTNFKRQVRVLGKGDSKEIHSIQNTQMIDWNCFLFHEENSERSEFKSIFQLIGTFKLIFIWTSKIWNAFNCSMNIQGISQ